MGDIQQLRWRSSDLFIGWITTLGETDLLQITYFPGGIWRLWYVNSRSGDEQELGEFATDEEAKAYARTWVGDDESEGVAPEVKKTKPRN